jgi:predicted GNAT family N-acyltransferase
VNLNAQLCAQAAELNAGRDLDVMDFERVARGLIAFHPTVESIGPLLQRASLEIPGLATHETVLRVYSHNPDSLFAISRETSTVRALAQPEGFIAQLPLNRAGEEALFNGVLDTADPDTRYLCRQNERPSAIYIWGIFVSHRLAGGIALIMERLSSAKNRTAPLYCKATSEKSWNFFLTLGFRPGVIWRGEVLPELMQYRRAGQASESFDASDKARACYDTIADPVQRMPDGTSIGVTVVHRLDDLLKVFSIRAATYVAEQDCPHAEEFDGNDFTATHLLGYVGAEPAGCLRLRYFAEFAKLERLAVIARFRQSRLAFHLIRAGIAFCRAKGYRRLYGHTEPCVAKIWERFGFRTRTSEPTFSFSGLDFAEGDLELAADPQALTGHSNPYVLVRPEGQWNRLGVLDQSARRPG